MNADLAVDLNGEPADGLRSSRRWLLVVVALLLLGGVASGTGAAVAVTPRHVAESRLLLGEPSLVPRLVGGYVLASRRTAETVARLAASTEVRSEIAARLSTSVEDVAAFLQVSPFPESPVVRLRATAASPLEARQRADTAAAVLQEVALRRLTPSELDALAGSAGSALTELAALRLAREEQRLARARALDEAAVNSGLLAARTVLRREVVPADQEVERLRRVVQTLTASGAPEAELARARQVALAAVDARQALVSRLQAQVRLAQQEARQVEQVVAADAALDDTGARLDEQARLLGVARARYRSGALVDRRAATLLPAPPSAQATGDAAFRFLAGTGAGVLAAVVLVALVRARAHDV